jgi:hypothetical protein
MGSDRARISFDPTRRYHAVVKQQGRVELEADENEAYSIVGELERLEAIDVIGPCGTPDDGYKITGGLPPFDFNIGPGTMYVGGMRVTLPDTLQYSKQTDWIDHTNDPMWVAPDKETGEPRDYVYLFLREQEVSAVEDTALREVALGGPDTAQRLRLIQRIVRLGTTARECDDALAEAEKHWAEDGLIFDPSTMMLESTARLKASYDNLNIAPDLCEPEAHGGYLGADNQLIRVQVTAAGKLVWGFDNASFLYRVKVIDDQTLELESSPVDSFHFPRAGQAVEVLRTAALLDGDDFVASVTGVVQTLTAPYNPDTHEITLPSALPGEYLDPAETPVVFLRVWEEEADFVPGTAVDLGQTGLQVTLTGGPPFHVGDYWMVAVRPSTATEVYPQRYLDAPQPPEGPRLWVCPLAVVEWDAGGLDVISDCREHFDDLVDLTKRRTEGCCTVTVGDGKISKGEFQDIQEAIEKVRELDRPVRVCILPGVYNLRGPVIIKEYADLIVGACDGQSRIIAESGDPAFVITGSRRVTLESLSISADTSLGAVLVLNSETVELNGCRIVNERKPDGFDHAPAVLVATEADDPSADFTLTGCHLEGAPAASIQALGARVYRNRMIGGGVWLREGTEDAIVNINEIGPGGWPGVLLGGLLESDKPADWSAGVSRVSIVRNQIRGLAVSGITTVRDKFGPGAQDRLSLIDGLAIEHNRIEDCVQQEIATVLDNEALGGVVLRQVAGLHLHANHIEGNGQGKLPACGVFLETCLSSVITNNTILGNGVIEPAAEEQFYQGGIVGLLLLELPVKKGDKSPASAGHAAFVHDNVVVTPRGQALLLVAAGSVSVADNSFTALDARAQPLAVAKAGLCVFIFDLGLPIELPTGPFFYGIAATPHFELGDLTGPSIDLTKGLTASKFPDGHLLVQGNQISLSISDKLDETSAAVGLATGDDLAFLDNQVQLQAPNGLLFDVLGLAFTARASGNRIQELPGRTLLSYFSFALRNTGTSNQATHCIYVLGPDAIDEHNHVLFPFFCDIIERLGKLDIEKG